MALRKFMTMAVKGPSLERDIMNAIMWIGANPLDVGIDPESVDQASWPCQR
jgi:hypothetical protein